MVKAIVTASFLSLYTLIPLLSYTSAQSPLRTGDVSRILSECNNPGDPGNLYPLDTTVATCMWETGHRNMFHSHQIVESADMQQVTADVEPIFKESLNAFLQVKLDRVLQTLNRSSNNAFMNQIAYRSIPLDLGSPNIPRPRGFSVEQWQWILTVRFQRFPWRCHRSEYRQVTSRRRRRYHRALNLLHGDYSLPPYNASKYEVLTMQHFNRIGEFGSSPEAHRGGGFWPWHRLYLLSFENALRMIDQSVCLIYWDPTPEGALERNAGQSHFFTDEFVGTGTGRVTSGAFANWNFTVAALEDDPLFFNYPGTTLARELYTPFFVELGAAFWTKNATAMMMNKPRYDNISWCTDLEVEQTHNFHHFAIGGFMVDGQFSAMDPIFIGWHTFMDKLWEEWRFTKQHLTENPFTTYVSECVPDTEFYAIFNLPVPPDYHAANGTMQPFGIRNSDTVRDISHLYTYSDRPTCSVQSPVCYSYRGRYLYCDTVTFTCVAKKTLGYSCSANHHCRTNHCQEGFCARRPQQDTYISNLRRYFDF